MKLMLSVVAVALLVNVGCNQSEPGGQKKEEFRISGPANSTTIKQDTTQTVELTLSRDKSFQQTVTLKAEAPKGLSAKVTPASVKGSEGNKASLEIKADKDAPEGEHTINVTATPETGAKTSVPVKVKVEKAS